MKTTTILSCLLAGALFSTAHAVEVANPAADYTGPTAAPAGWAYFYSSTATGGSEMPMSANTAVAGGAGNAGFTGSNSSAILGSHTSAQYEIFADGFDGSGASASQSATGNGGVVGTDLLLNPGSTAADAFVIARYTISAADVLNGATATITGSFRNLVVRNTSNANSQGSVDVYVYHNATPLFSVDQINELATASMLSQALGTFNITGLTVAVGDTISFVVGNNEVAARDETALVASIDLSGEVPTEIPAVVTNDPDSQDILLGDDLILNVTAVGDPTITYQWRKDTVAIDTATNPSAATDTLAISPTLLTTAGNYDCVVTNDFGDDTSAAATITIDRAPVSSAPDETTEVNRPLILAVADLATDPDLDPLTIASADATSVGGALISFNANKIAYIPVADSLATDDTFTCVVSDGRVGDVTVTVTVDVVASASADTLIADPAFDYLDSATLPANWSYFGADVSTGSSSEFPLVAEIALGNGGNTGFGDDLAGSANSVPGVLGRIDGGAEFEIFNDGQAGHGGLAGVDLLLSPGAGAALLNDTVIVRYTFDGVDITAHGSTAKISGSFRDLGGNTGGGGANSIVASVYLNGTELWTATGAAGRLFEVDGTFDLSGGVTVTAGDELSFVVYNNGGYGGDETALRAAISLSTDEPVPTGYAGWIGGFSGLSDVTAGGDPDFDGIVNLMEYVLNGNPGASDTGILPSGGPLGENWVFSCTRREESSTDTTQMLQFGDDLSSWTDVPIDGVDPLPPGVTVDLGTPSGGLQTVTVTISNSLAPNGIGFGRLKVTHP